MLGIASRELRRDYGDRGRGNSGKAIPLLGHVLRWVWFSMVQVLRHDSEKRNRSHWAHVAPRQVSRRDDLALVVQANTTQGSNLITFKWVLRHGVSQFNLIKY